MEDELKAKSTGTTHLFSQSEVPVFQNKVYDTPEEAKSAPTGIIEISRSRKTGFIFNSAFDGSLMNYDGHYDNEQSNSAQFQQHLREVFDKLSAFGLHNKKVVEIGCGKAHFFDLLKENSIDCIGFDPAYLGDDPAIVRDYFGKNYQINADVIILRHTMEHIEYPHSFLTEIAEANNFRGHVFIEVPTFDWINKKQAFWDIFYEHCNYFTERTLECMFNNAYTGSFFGGQYIYCYAALSDLKKHIKQQKFDELEEFTYRESVEKWKKFLVEKEDLVIWGAGAKGSTFVNILDPQREKIKFLIDINPVKQNRFIARTAHPIHPPEKIREYNIKNVLVMNENYLEEISEIIDDPAVNIYCL